jgi:hypothetical protein
VNITTYNERIKYFATLLNTIAAAMFTIGVLAPFVAWLYGSGPKPPQLPAIALGAVLWLFLTICVHLCVQFILGDLI